MRAGLIAGSGFLLLLGTLTGTVARADIASCAGTGATFAGGSGTTASPYQVADDTQLAAIDDTGAGRLDYLTCAFIQTADITLSGSWAPIGASSGSDPYDSNVPFTGSYDGDSHTISGLSITAPGATFDADGIGLFASLHGATVQDVNIVSASVRADLRENVGILVGVARESTISGVTTSGEVQGIQMVGGLAGKITEGTTVSHSHSSADDTTYFGGGGGLIGNASKDSGALTHVIASSASGSVAGLNPDNGKGAGGLVGTSYGGLDIVDSWATGDVSERGASITGGLIGLMYGSDVSVSRSFASGDVTVVGTGPAGGLVGGLYEGATIANSFATGLVTGQTKVGGLVGYVGGSAAGTTTNGYSVSEVVTASADDTGGGILGAADPALEPVMITSTFWNPTSAGPRATNSYGTQATLAQMSLTSTYVSSGWSISEDDSGTSTWVINPASGCLPYLRSIPASRVATPISGATACAPPAPSSVPEVV